MAGKKNKQIACLPFRVVNGKIRLLLITSRETQRWIIPKGWLMPGLKDYQAAEQEAHEEAGVAGNINRKPLGKFTYVKRGSSSSKTMRVVVYALEVTELLRDWPEKDERKRKWFALENALELVSDKDLRRLLKKHYE